MNTTLSNNEFKLFQNYIEQKCGIEIKQEKAYLIETRLAKMLVDSGLSTFEELYHTIRHDNDPYISEKIIDAIITNETLWFRDKTPWVILQESLMPKFIEQLRSGKIQKIRIWSAASSTGQEAYSTAMCIDHYLAVNQITDVTLQDFEILATDISKTIIEIAANGRYNSISIMRGLDDFYKQKYFQNTGLVWVLDERIRKAVTFKQFNLQNSFMFLGKFDVVFCRYVLIYFSQVLKEDISSKLRDCILENGVLFLGASELYFHFDSHFEMKHHKDATYYERRQQQT